MSTERGRSVLGCALAQSTSVTIGDTAPATRPGARPLPLAPAARPAPPRPAAGPAAGLMPARPGGGDQPALLADAERFIISFHRDTPALGSPVGRLREVRRELRSTGTYQHTTGRTVYAARVAWRNSSRCIGRLYWRSLRVRDLRRVTSAPEIAAETIAHLRQATNGGRIRPVISVFAPDTPARPGPRILCAQRSVRRLRGRWRHDYRGPGQCQAHPARPVARLAAASDQPRPFDVLPLMIRAAGGAPTCTSYRPTPCCRSPCATRRSTGSASSGSAGTRSSDHRHVPGGRRDQVPRGPVQRLVHVHRDRLP